MRKTGFVFLGLATLAVVSCTSVAPVKVSTGEQCFRCRRTIMDTRFAGETIDPNGFVSKFRAPGCMAKYLEAHPDERGTTFVTDYATGKMVNPDAALFVPVLIDPNSGEREYQAYLQKADAAAAAIREHTVPVAWSVVLEKARS
jgi:hypothetical protein